MTANRAETKGGGSMEGGSGGGGTVTPWEENGPGGSGAPSADGVTPKQRESLESIGWTEIVTPEWRYWSKGSTRTWWRAVGDWETTGDLVQATEFAAVIGVAPLGLVMVSLPGLARMTYELMAESRQTPWDKLDAAAKKNLCDRLAAGAHP